MKDLQLRQCIMPYIMDIEAQHATVLTTKSGTRPLTDKQKGDKGAEFGGDTRKKKSS